MSIAKKKKPQNQHSLTKNYLVYNIPGLINISLFYIIFIAWMFGNYGGLLDLFPQEKPHFPEGFARKKLYFLGE